MVEWGLVSELKVFSVVKLVSCSRQKVSANLLPSLAQFKHSKVKAEVVCVAVVSTQPPDPKRTHQMTSWLSQ